MFSAVLILHNDLSFRDAESRMSHGLYLVPNRVYYALFFLHRSVISPALATANYTWRTRVLT
jgi:hypothetical protein